MAVYIILRTCMSCGGDGEHIGNIPNTVKPCDRCGGDGVYEVGTVDLTDLEDKVDTLVTQVQALYDDLNP